MDKAGRIKLVKINAYATTDGRTFHDRKEAAQEQFLSDINTLFNRYDIVGLQTPSVMAEALLEHIKEFLDVMLAYECNSYEPLKFEDPLNLDS